MGITVRQKRTGGPFFVFVHRDGKRKSKRIGDKKTADAVAERLREELRKAEHGTAEPDKIIAASEGFRSYGGKWLVKYAKGACKTSTYENYESIKRVHLDPFFGDKPISEIAKREVKELVLVKLGEGHSPKTVTNIKNCASSIFSTAVEDEIISSNPAIDLGKKMARLLSSKKLRKNVNFLRETEAKTFLDKAKEMFPWLYVFFLIAVRTGLRLGELIALTPGDIHFDEGYIMVDKAIVRGELTTPKNGKSRRVDMSRQLAHVLRQFLGETERDVKERGWEKRPETLFYNEADNPLDPDNLRSRYFYRILYEAGMRHFRIHDLRHTFASALIAKKESLAYICEQMGHSSIQVTVDLYGHLVPGDNRQAMDKLDDPGWDVAIRQEIEEEMVGEAPGVVDGGGRPAGSDLVADVSGNVITLNFKAGAPAERAKG